MLFDLRSRHRRWIIRIVYGFLAVLLVGGGIGFGIGYGGSGGGLVDAFTGAPSNNNGPAASLVAQDKQLSSELQKQPKNQTLWLQLVGLRLQIAGQGSNYNSNDNTYTASGLQELTKAAQAWNSYLALKPKSPDAATALRMAAGFAALGQAPGAFTAQQIGIKASPTLSNYYALAVYAYDAHQFSAGDAATAKALKLAPANMRAKYKADLAQIKKKAQG